MKKTNSIIIYQDKKFGIRLETHLENETVWLTQKQMSLLFNKDVRTVNEHIQNIYKEGELTKKPTIRKSRIVQKEGGRNIERDIETYNLDVIISVGYRVKSLQGTNFRIWATNVLRKHIVDGYTINESRLIEANNKFNELQNAISIIQNTAKKKTLSSGQLEEVISVLDNYSKALTILDDYDREEIKEIKGTKSNYKLTYEDCRRVIEGVRQRFVQEGEKEVFALEKDYSFKSVIENLYQTYNGKELYKTTEEKAANLLYLIIKDHSFIGGNKRVGAIIFAYFLEKANILYKKDGEKKINDNGLVALTLLIADSDPKDKDILVKMVNNLLV